MPRNDQSVKLKVRESTPSLTELQELGPRNRLRPTSLIRDVYRALLGTGRVYGAFTDTERQIVQSLRDRGDIIDPMSGYGSLTKFCAESGTSSFCLELNPAQYLWQVLTHPDHAILLPRAIDFLLSSRSRWPRTTERATMSQDWFPEQSLAMLTSLYSLSLHAIRSCGAIRNSKAEELALALVLPFAGRLGCWVSGDTSAHVKRGGICVYRGWSDDYREYLLALLGAFERIPHRRSGVRHRLHLGDARTYSFPHKSFGGMITSPPYPNRLDFSAVFDPETALLSWLRSSAGVKLRLPQLPSIGSLFVRGRQMPLPESRAARRFLATIQQLKRTPRATYDDAVYYVPYFSHYFADLERAYSNVAVSLAQSAEGYITVVNNTHRNTVVPVAEMVQDTWRRLGFKTVVHQENERFHVGTKNPRTRGLRAKHVTYVIKLWRH